MSITYTGIAAADVVEDQPAAFAVVQPQGTDARTWWRSWAARSAASPLLPTSVVQALSTAAAADAAAATDAGKGTAQTAAPFKPITLMGEWFYCGGDSSDWDGLLD